MSPEVFMYLDLFAWLLSMLADAATVVIALGVAVLAYRSLARFFICPRERQSCPRARKSFYRHVRIFALVRPVRPP